MPALPGGTCGFFFLDVVFNREDQGVKRGIELIRNMCYTRSSCMRCLIV